MLLLVALLVGSVNVWGQSDYSAVYTSNCTISGSYASTIVIDSKNYSGQKAGTSGAGGSISVTVPKDTKYLHLHMSGWSGESPSVSVSSSPAGVTTTTSITVTANSGFNSNSPYTFSGDPSTSSYYKVITFTNPLVSQTTLTFSTSGGKKRFIIWGVNAEILPSSVTIKNGDDEVSNLNMTVGDDDVTLSATVAPANASQTVTWTSDDTNVATVTNGTVHAVAPGTAKIKATSSLNTVYAECSVTVISGSTLGNIVFSPQSGAYYYGEPITISAPNNEYIYYTTDSSTPTRSSSKYTAPLTLTHSMTLKALAVKGSDEQIGSIDYTLKAPEAPTFDVAAGAVAENTPLTITAGEGGFTIKYTIDGTDPTVSSETYSAPIVIDNALTIKACTMDAGNNLSSVTSASYTLTLPEGSKRYVLMTDVNQLTDGGKIIIVNNDENYTMNTTSDANNRPAVSITTTNNEIAEESLPETAQVIELEKVIYESDNTEKTGWYFKVGTDAYLYAASSGSNHLKTSTKKTVDNNGRAKISINNNDITSISFTGSNTRNVLQYNPNNGTPIFACYASASQKAVKIYVQETEPATVKANVTDAGWATYATKYPMTFEDGDAYVIVSADDKNNTTTMQKVTSVPANTAVLLKGTAGEATVKTATIISGNAPSPLATNYLHIVAAGETINAGSKVYVLANKSGIGFYPWTGTALARGKVYMRLPAGAKMGEFYGFGEEVNNETDGISNVSARSNKQGEFYNLAGQRVSNPTKGLYIVNGKKVIIK